MLTMTNFSLNWAITINDSYWGDGIFEMIKLKELKEFKLFLNLFTFKI